VQQGVLPMSVVAAAMRMACEVYIASLCLRSTHYWLNVCSSD